MKKAIGTVKKIVILVLVLVVPGFLYYLLTSQGKNRYKPLPFFGPKQIAKTGHSVHGKLIPDTIYHTVPDFSLLDQNGAPVTQSSFNNKIVIVDFFYIHCPSVCNIVSDNIKALLSEYEKNKLICFVSVTVDPKNDSPTVLKNYAKRFGPSDKWLFLTGDTSTVYNLARKGFLVDALQRSNGDFIYSDKLILMDSDRRIRGYYTGASTAEVSRLDDEIKVLISEELRKNDTPLY